MPLYFAYGLNLDRVAMGHRCPSSRPMAPARLTNHRFFIMRQGYASVRRESNAAVHGLLWNLALADVAALDRFEEVGQGLYSKTIVSVLISAGNARSALMYMGRDREVGAPKTGYMESVASAAAACGLPPAYLRELRSWLPQGNSNGPPIRPR